jgi:S1-C subfamily serine protease
MKPLFRKIYPLVALAPLCHATPEIPGLVTIRSFDKVTPIENKDAPAVNQSLGFIIEKDGHLLTNHSNLTKPGNGTLLEDFHIGLTDGSGRTFTATIIGVEPTINLGILKIEGGETQQFETAKASRGELPAVGTKLHAVSKTDGKQTGYVDGTVNGINTRECYQESLTSTMFRAQIAIPETSLGGPVIAADSGAVLAIYTGFKPVAEKDHQEVTGETHLLPLNLCFNIYESIKMKGSMKSPWTGFSVRGLDEAERKFFPTAKKHHGGVALEYIWPGGPAEKLGLRAGDILVQLSYNRIVSVADFQKWLYMFGVGQPVKLMILRDGREYLIADYVIEERPQAARPK